MAKLTLTVDTNSDETSYTFRDEKGQFARVGYWDNEEDAVAAAVRNGHEVVSVDFS
jgi:hypothetical protein